MKSNDKFYKTKKSLELSSHKIAYVEINVFMLNFVSEYGLINRNI